MVCILRWNSIAKKIIRVAKGNDPELFDDTILVVDPLGSTVRIYFPDHFGFFLPLAGITTVREITENAFDIRATSRLSRLYVELLKDNPEWGTAARRPRE